jgi:multicomponent Na+:H+ antiporter subunit E
MRNTLILSVAMAFLWMLFARQVSPQGFIVGYIFGFGVLWLLRLNTSIEDNEEPINLRRVPGQLFALVIYSYRLTKDVILSGTDVAKRVLRPEMDINPGVHTISTLDPTNNPMISGLSGHGITITPGEFVIDYETDDDGQTFMIVHALDKESSDVAKLEGDQKNRLILIRRILGIKESDYDI